MADGAIQPFEALVDWNAFAVRIHTSKLGIGSDPSQVRSHGRGWYQPDANTSQLDRLHGEAAEVLSECGGAAKVHSPRCTRLRLVSRVRQLERVRNWFLYNASTPYSVYGMFLIELHCRQLNRSAQHYGTCSRYPFERHGGHNSTSKGAPRASHASPASAPAAAAAADERPGEAEAEVEQRESELTRTEDDRWYSAEIGLG